MDYLQPARRIADDLLEQARRPSDGSLTWGRGAGNDRQPVADSGPFNGRCGEALLFAALHAAVGEAGYEDAALDALAGLRRGLPSAPYRRALVRSIELGLGGVGGIVYALVRIGELLERRELLEQAELLAGEVTPELIAGDRRLDVIWGAAGALHGLLALHRASGSGPVLAAAERCARHLLSHRLTDPASGLRAWGNLHRDAPTTGFAHGSSGVAHALLLLHRHTGASELYRAALEAFAFERTLYQPERSNWLDSLEPDALETLMWSWCHGSPGIGLARLALLECVRPEDESLVAHDLRAAIESSIVARIPGVDTICCGYFGRIDFLLEAGRRLGNEALERRARELASARLERARTKGFLLTSDDDVLPHLRPGLWQGLGGTAYVLLRLTNAKHYPCLLAMK